jgi:hypothetical protein
MRNIFDQYMQSENRVTHAFMTALNQDRKLLALFLRDLVRVKSPTPSEKLSVLEQQFPGEAGEPPEFDEAQRRGIPDGWIFDGEKGWCVFLECKVISPFLTEQLRRHRRTAERLGFRDITAVVITPTAVAASLGDKIVRLEWREVYVWLRQQGTSAPHWARHAADYFEIAEAKLIEDEKLKEGTLTKFSGFPFGFDRPYTYLEGKRILALARDELSKRRDLVKELGMNPAAPGRSAITGRQGSGVWDFLSIAPSGDKTDFTRHPHLTLGIQSRAVEAMVTVPHHVNNQMRRKLVSLEEAGFQALIEDIVARMNPLLKKQKGATPWFLGLQRRYLSQRATPFNDARIEFDLRTATDGGLPKTQPKWLSAAYGAFVDKEGSNYQIQVGVVFPYQACRELRHDSAIDLLAQAWLACKPLIDLDL